MAHTTSESRDEHIRRATVALQHHLGAHMRWLTESDVCDLMLNDDGSLWVDRLGFGMTHVGSIGPAHAETIIGMIASLAGQTVSQDKPILECELPQAAPWNGARFTGTLPPIVRQATFALRRPAHVIYTLGDYVKDGILSDDQMMILAEAILLRKNIVISGGTGSGKTTLANAILGFMATAQPDDRLLIMEDTRELRCASRNAVWFCTSGTVDMRKLLRTALRYRLDRPIIGEVRGGEALDLLKAWNTGHPGGICTIHANSASHALTRLEHLIAEVSLAPMKDLIREAVNVVVHIERCGANPKGRRVTEVLQVT